MHLPVYIYAIRNTVTKRVYIGRSGKLKDRYLQHMTALHYRNHKNELMQKDFDDFGIDSFTFSILEKIDSYKDIRQEREWMRKFNSTDPRFGYNYLENIADKDIWTEPSWVEELKARIGKCPDRSSRVRKPREER